MPSLHEKLTDPATIDLAIHFVGCRMAMLDRMDYWDSMKEITLLAKLLLKPEASDAWWLGEGSEFSVSDLIIGAYWHFAEWHEGQPSQSYEALSLLSQLYQPNHERGPGEGGERYAYELLAGLAEGEKVA